MAGGSSSNTFGLIRCWALRSRTIALSALRTHQHNHQAKSSSCCESYLDVTCNSSRNIHSCQVRRQWRLFTCDKLLHERFPAGGCLMPLAVITISQNRAAVNDITIFSFARQINISRLTLHAGAVFHTVDQLQVATIFRRVTLIPLHVE